MDKNKLKNNAIEGAQNILADSKNIKSYGTATLFEHIYASMWLKMPIEQLEAQRELLNKIIKERKIKVKIIEADKCKKKKE